jgi:hypothetical protein
MLWIGFLLLVFFGLGFRDRTAEGSPHLTILVVTALTLGVVLVGLK